MTRRRSSAGAALALALGWTLLAAPAAAQGRSGQAPGSAQRNSNHPGNGPPVTPPGTPSPATPPLATWLDDASVPGRGSMWLTASVGRWSSDAGRTLFAPALSFVAGIAPRTSLGASLSVYHFRDTAGATQSGVSDSSVFGKVALVDPATHHAGLALTPIVEIFNQATSSGTTERHASFAVPVSVEARSEHARVYGSVGYFFDGVVFFTGAIELRAGSRFAVTATAGHTYATRQDVTVTTTRQRSDVSVAGAVLASTHVALFGAIGHSFSGDPVADGGPWVAAGVSIGRAVR